MENKSSIYQQLREARRAAGLTQMELARQLGCTQSALSMYEMGKTTALAQDTVKKLADKLGVTLPEEESVYGERPVAVLAAHGMPFCGNAQCPSNHPYLVGAELFLAPTGAAGKGHRCVICGEVLESGCPHCGSAVRLPGGCCAACGRPLLPVPEGFPGEDIAAWMKAQRETLAALRAFRGNILPE